MSQGRINLAVNRIVANRGKNWRDTIAHLTSDERDEVICELMVRSHDRLATLVNDGLFLDEHGE